ncbi:MAG: tetratricopeptide repeat protein [Planctomycetota bacterium]
MDFRAAKVDPTYKGKYPYTSIRPYLETAARRGFGAFRRAHEVLSLPTHPAKQPWIRIRDAAPMKPGRYPGPAAEIFAEMTDGRFHLTIQFYAEYLINGSGSFEKRLLHEMVHAAMRLALGDTRYAGVPCWLREGMALYIAKQGYTRVRYEFSITLDVKALFNGLTQAHEARDYAEDFLAVDFLVRRGGSSALLQLMNLLLAGTPPDRAVERAAGVEEGEFEEAFRHHALEALSESARQELDAFLPAFRRFQDGQYKEALSRFEAYGRRKPKGKGVLAGSLQGKALYYRAKCLFQLGRTAEALQGFKDVRTSFAQGCGLADDASFFEAESAFRLGKIVEAREGFRGFVRDYPYSSFAAAGYHKLGLCAYLLQDYRDAKDLCLATWKAFPDHELAENALYDGANAARALGEHQEALDLFQRFLATFPKSRFRNLAEARIRELKTVLGQ